MTIVLAIAAVMIAQPYLMALAGRLAARAATAPALQPPQDRRHDRCSGRHPGPADAYPVGGFTVSRMSWWMSVLST